MNQSEEKPMASMSVSAPSLKWNECCPTGLLYCSSSPYRGSLEMHIAVKGLQEAISVGGQLIRGKNLHVKGYLCLLNQSLMSLLNQ